MDSDDFSSQPAATGGQADESTGEATAFEDLVGASTSFSNAAQLVVGRAATDPDFRNRLVDHPDEALSDFEVTEDERRLLSGLERGLLESVVENLKEELMGVVAQAQATDQQIIDLAESWEATLLEIDLEDDEPGEDKAEGEEQGAEA
jgi:hypothetical protein